MKKQSLVLVIMQWATCLLAIFGLIHLFKGAHGWGKWLAITPLIACILLSIHLSLLTISIDVFKKFTDRYGPKS